MAKAIIKITSREVIDSTSSNSIEQSLFNASYDEFLLKSQVYNPEGKFKTFSEMRMKDGRANSLHYKCGFAIDSLMMMLNKKIPGLYTSLAEPVYFDIYRFELIESDITDKTAHKIAIYYTTEALALHENFGENLLLSLNEVYTQSVDGLIDNCFMISLRPGVSISSYQKL